MFRPRSDTMSTSYSLNTAPEKTIAATSAADASRRPRTANAKRTSDERLSLLSQVSEQRYDTKSRILKMCRLLENKKRRALSYNEAEALTERIESILYKSSANDQGAFDRVKSILAERQQQRQQLLVSTSSSSFNNGEKQIDLLEDILGRQRMSQIEQFVSEIRAIRSSTSWAGIIRASLALNTSTGTSTSLAHKMPKEVDVIYFRTRLVSAYAHIKSQASGPSFDPKQVHTYNWSELIDEAKANIAAYRDLEDTHKNIIAETPVVCMGGLCSRKESSPRAA